MGEPDMGGKRKGKKGKFAADSESEDEDTGKKKPEAKEPDTGGKKKGKKGKFAADSESEDEDAGKKKPEAKEPDMGGKKKKKGKFAADSRWKCPIWGCFRVGTFLCAHPK